MWDLVNTQKPYPKAVPVLFEHLESGYPEPIREGIARALAVPEANTFWGRILAHYKGEKSGRLKDGLAVALAGAATPKERTTLLEVVRNRRHGPSRLLLLPALIRLSPATAEEVLEEFKDDPDLRKEVRVLQRVVKRKT